MYLISWPGGSWQATLTLTAVILGIYIGVMWLALVFWTYRDIRQRTRDPILQTIAVLLVLALFLPGLWVYLILRPRQTLAEAYERSLEEEALLQELEDQKACPSCKRRVHDDYLVCPSCSAQLKEPCRQCSKPLSYAWMVCPFCGLQKPARERPRQVPRPAGNRPAAVNEGTRVPAGPAPAPATPIARAAKTPPPVPAPRSAAVTEIPPQPLPRREPTAQRPATVRMATDEGPLIDATRD